MPKLNEYFTSDLDNTFFNSGEFATEETIDGVPMLVVIDDDQLQRYNLKNGGEGLAQGELLFHVQTSNFTELPFVEKRLLFNSDIYEIIHLSENEGMYTITLARYYT